MSLSNRSFNVGQSGNSNSNSKSRSPFKDFKVFEDEIKEFANKHRITISSQAKRTSEYFEMSCFNNIVRFYENNGYSVKVRNLQGGEYRYKCTPSGIQSNFSHFEVSILLDKVVHSFEVHHNLAVQSSYDDMIFTAPDISIIRKNAVEYTVNYYETKKTFSFVRNINMLTFCEVKQFNPFPELIFNFIGVLNELKRSYMKDKGKELSTLHIAPSLMISGKASKQTQAIKESLESRYCINILFDLFNNSKLIFSKGKFSGLRKAGRLNGKSI